MGDDDFDLQLRKAFQELQSQILDSREKQKNAEITKNALKQNITIADLVKYQLDRMPKDRPVYRSAGRIFLLETVDYEIKRQEDDAKQCKERISVLDKQKDYLNKSISESEKNLRDLISRRN